MASKKVLTPRATRDGVKFKWKMLDVAGGNFNRVFPLDYGNTVKWNNTIYAE